MGQERADIWNVKLAAWLHDPAEKALILMRADHEKDSSIARLRELLFPGGIPLKSVRCARLADHWASAADRPILPKPGDPEYRRALDIRFWGREGAVLKHPMDGTSFHLPDVYLASAGNLEKASFGGLVPLLKGCTNDPRTSFLRLWRLGPESPPPGLGLGHLWQLLPADTRIPDHSIWEHLSLTSAFAGAMAGDPDDDPALLAVSLGPVQTFIAQSRSTADLWAGSHLLAAMSWQAMKVVCERFGPDAVIFPNLWGVPLVDIWLEEAGVVFPEGKQAPEWKRSGSDANPLFMAALPNRFVALVPAFAAESVAEEIIQTVRNWVVGEAKEAAEKLLEFQDTGEDETHRRQIEEQLAGFPEVHWAAVPFAPLVQWEEARAKKGVKTSIRSLEGLREALATFHTHEDAPGFLGSEQWKLLQDAIEGGGIVYVPNPGVLYPALYDLLDRLLGAAKTAKPFEQTSQRGYRCTLCGELEWLRGPGDEVARDAPPGQRTGTLWSRVAKKHPSWARKGEHLCVPCMLKRLWPTLFSEWAAGKVPEVQHERLDRYVVSTHTMALARDLIEAAQSMKSGSLPGNFASLRDREEAARVSKVALPMKVYKALRDVPDHGVLAKVPSLLDVEDEEASAGTSPKLMEELKCLFGHRPEAYYAMVLFDGDRMGAWVSGSDPELQLPFEETWHPQVVSALAEQARGNLRLDAYMKAPRPSSPGRHAAMSAALNGFSLHVARWVVEGLFAGKVIYAGGDDVLAMLPVDDVLPALLVLRCAYSGVMPASDRTMNWMLRPDGEEVRVALTRIGNGFVRIGGENGRLFRMMGRFATASAGAVIAHHKTPLQGVLRELRAAEKRAKDEGGRNAFSIALMKRAGGTTHFTAGFGFGGKGWEPAADDPTALGVLFQFRDTLATEGVSRRAAYNVIAWLPDFPARPNEELAPDALGEMLRRSIAWQLGRQGVTTRTGFPKGFAEKLASGLVAVADMEAGKRGDSFSYTAFLSDLVTVAEFLAREGRALPPPREEQQEGKRRREEGGAQ